MAEPEKPESNTPLAVILWILMVIAGADAFNLMLRSTGLSLVWAVVLAFAVAGTATRSIGVSIGAILTCVGWIALRGLYSLYVAFF